MASGGVSFAGVRPQHPACLRHLPARRRRPARGVDRGAPHGLLDHDALRRPAPASVRFFSRVRPPRVAPYAGPERQIARFDRLRRADLPCLPHVQRAFRAGRGDHGPACAASAGFMGQTDGQGSRLCDRVRDSDRSLGTPRPGGRGKVVPGHGPALQQNSRPGGHGGRMVASVGVFLVGGGPAGAGMGGRRRIRSLGGVSKEGGSSGAIHRGSPRRLRVARADVHGSREVRGVRADRARDGSVPEPRCRVRGGRHRAVSSRAASRAGRVRRRLARACRVQHAAALHIHLSGPSGSGDAGQVRQCGAARAHLRRAGARRVVCRSEIPVRPRQRAGFLGRSSTDSDSPRRSR